MNKFCCVVVFPLFWLVALFLTILGALVAVLLVPLNFAFDCVETGVDYCATKIYEIKEYLKS